MKRWMIAGLVWAMAMTVMPACDRRDDPSVPPASTGSSTPPGERVDAGADDKAAVKDEPVHLTQPPPTATECDGKVGDELAACLQDRAARSPAPAP
ncbi:hypothetical protein M8R20_28660 [Pseudomonas sp. R2.Fl]|nr:hypothetical protein [Pseudomonas sp. R2.Fl]